MRNDPPDYTPAYADDSDMLPSLESQLYATLHDMDLHHWFVAIATLVSHYAGIEKMMELDDPTPVRQILTVVEAAQASVAPWRERTLLYRLARLPLFCWQSAYNDAGARWDPLAEPLRDFCARGRVVYWQRIDPNPPPEVIEDWLQRLVRVEVGRRPCA